MPRSITLLATFVLVLFSTIVLARGQSQEAGAGPKGSTKAALQFLIDSAASDFHAQHEPHAARFRHVRLGHAVTTESAKQYRLCGEFLPAQGKAKAEWTPFATIKTSGYEQYLGAQAANFCEGSKVIWDKEGDLSSALQSRFDSMR